MLLSINLKEAVFDTEHLVCRGMADVEVRIGHLARL
jgi:hypothetical protein